MPATRTRGRVGGVARPGWFAEPDTDLAGPPADVAAGIRCRLEAGLLPAAGDRTFPPSALSVIDYLSGGVTGRPRPDGGTER